MKKTRGRPRDFSKPTIKIQMKLPSTLVKKMVGTKLRPTNLVIIAVEAWLRRNP